MSAVARVGVIGGGAAGMAAAILLADGGVTVEVVEAKPDLSALGSGITLSGNALRVLRGLGVWEEVRAHGYSFDKVAFRAPDPHGTVLAEVPDARLGGPDLPATTGMYRPDLARILAERARGAGARIRFGVAATGLEQAAAGVELATSDGVTEHYDLVIGADGLHSATRQMLGIDVAPVPTGMGIWRAFTGRPASITHTDLYYGGPCFIAGYCPTGEDSIYAYLVEPAQDRSGVSDDEALAIMRGLAEAYHGPWDDIRPLLSTGSRINYTWFTQHLIPGAWNRGRVVLIGDAAHSCPPTMAQGAAMALEDAAVLAELLLAADTVDDGLWNAFHERRSARVRAVVDASVQLGQWLLDGERDADVPGLIGRLHPKIATPA
ncbi:FAD-dependent monooxygenase [Actinoplanes sp. KI2]|uniref:FAD-dependent monooxygenase n=1 Tax=Actinoplanes sp. KI2 TaxID=2983315 RepID=UPI0021D5CC3D|nr:FAD-dependent monooxygenase [Actinoplanes sp. KI2]MCU7729587.1 FAD-dependent monooxygenase [Actinoplanes sp. KI2]